MKNNDKINRLQKLLDKAETLKVENNDDPDFKSWKNLVERTLINIFGKQSTEFEHFSNLLFYYHAVVFISTSDYTADHLQAFRRDYKMLIDSINEYIDEFKGCDTELEDSINENIDSEITKIFISHASKDALIVEEIIEILESIGLDSNQIFCTSFDGYGIDLGENFLDAIKTELSSDSLVLFILSKNFYQSPVCMCEMGASWVLSKEHIPIIVPPLNFDDIKGVIPLTQGFKLNESLKLNSFKEKIEKVFNIKNTLSFSAWERKRDRICLRINKLIS